MRFMFHKFLCISCFVVFISVFFVPEGYSQTQTEQSISLKEQQEGRTLMVAACKHSMGFRSTDRGQRAFLRLNQGVNSLDWSFSWAAGLLQAR